MNRNLLLIGLVFAAQFTFAQSDRKSGIETKTIEVEKHNGETTVSVTTKKNGNVTTEVYSGKEAEQWLEENDRPLKDNSKKQQSVSIHIDQDDIDEMKADMDEIQDDIAKELDAIAKKIENISIDSVLRVFDIEVTNTEDRVQYEYKSDGDKKRSIVILKSSGASKDFDIDVQYEIETEDDQETEELTVTKRSFLVEDDTEAKSSLKLKDLSVYPNPADQVLKVDFTSNSTDQIIVTLKNAKGSLVSTMKTAGKGEKNLVMDLNDLPAGVYHLSIAQGQETLNKKLIIQ